MPSMDPREAGKLGGRISGKSKSAKKLEACRRNGFQPVIRQPEPRADGLTTQEGHAKDGAILAAIKEANPTADILTKPIQRPLVPIVPTDPKVKP